MFNAVFRCAGAGVGTTGGLDPLFADRASLSHYDFDKDKDDNDNYYVAPGFVVIRVVAMG